MAPARDVELVRGVAVRDEERRDAAAREERLAHGLPRGRERREVACVGEEAARREEDDDVREACEIEDHVGEDGRPEGDAGAGELGQAGDAYRDDKQSVDDRIPDHLLNRLEHRIVNEVPVQRELPGFLGGQETETPSTVYTDQISPHAKNNYGIQKNAACSRHVFQKVFQEDLFLVILGRDPAPCSRYPEIWSLLSRLYCRWANHDDKGHNTPSANNGTPKSELC